MASPDASTVGRVPTESGRRETSRYLVPAAIATPVELTVILGQDAPTEDQSGNSRRIESATSHGPCASRCCAHMRVFARKSAAVDPAANARLANQTRCGSVT